MHHCDLHDYQTTKVCSGRLKKGGQCTRKATDASRSDVMPTCGIHRDQVKVASWCQAQLSCGFECGRHFEWKPHGFQLCPAHRKDERTCYFLRIPREIRFRVYRYLLPDRQVPARFWSSSQRLRADGKRVCTAILRVNKLIHDEAADVLYSRTVFEIELSELGLSICNLSSQFVQSGLSLHGNYVHTSNALQDYQMQLMLLEQQNKQRLLMARQGLAYSNGESSSTVAPMTLFIPRRTWSPTPYDCGLIDSLWHPTLSDTYFDMIRSFLIQFIFPPIRGSIPVADIHKTLESRLYDYCDQLHKLIGRLQLPQRTIAHLEIIIRFGDAYTKREEASSAAKLLLRPLRRISNIARPKVLSITMKDSQYGEIDLLVPDWVSSAADRTFAENLKCWSEDLSSSQPSFQCPHVFEAYWRLEKLLSSIKRRCYSLEPRFHMFTDLHHAARIAREADDLTRFKEIWDQVLEIWFDYLDQRKMFQSYVALSIDVINDIVGKESHMSGLGSGEGT